MAGIAISALAILLALLAAAQPASAAWPGRNGPIVFAGGGPQSGTGLWAIRASGKGLRHLTLDSSDAEPQSSPNGRWVVFVRSVVVALPGGGGVFPARHIFRARSDGSGIREVTDGPIFDRSPSFAPSGKRILFSRSEFGTPGQEAQDSDIFSVRLDGTGLHRITSGPGDDRNPVFSPNGRLIAFDRFLEAHGRHVYTMRPDGSRVVDATPNLAAWSSQADFSPSGNRIVFVRGFPGSAIADLYTMRPDGQRLERLTGRPNHPHGRFSNPSFSPDGQFVVAELDSEFQFSRLQIVRVRDRSLGAGLGGRRFPGSPDMRDPVWLPR